MAIVSNGLIPVLDFEALNRSPHSRKSLRMIEEYREILSRFGFEKIQRIGITPRTILNAYKQVRFFFGLPLDEKMKYQSKTEFGDPMGYIPARTERAKGAAKPNLMEMFQFGNPAYGYNVWPDTEYAQFRKVMETLYYEAADVAGPTLMTATERAYGYPDGSLSSILANGNTSIRLIRYAPLDDLDATDDEPLSERHEDINLKTILLPNAIDGPDTQILLPESTSLWHSLGNQAGVFIINSGDMLKLFSTRYLDVPCDVSRALPDLLPDLLSYAVIPSTTHRVQRPVDRTKASYRIVIFLHPRPLVILAHGISAGNFLKFRMSENYGQKIH